VWIFIFFLFVVSLKLYIHANPLPASILRAVG
jgi:hypothetical protein